MPMSYGVPARVRPAIQRPSGCGASLDVKPSKSPAPVAASAACGIAVTTMLAMTPATIVLAASLNSLFLIVLAFLCVCGCCGLVESAARGSCRCQGFLGALVLARDELQFGDPRFLRRRASDALQLGDPRLAVARAMRCSSAISCSRVVIVSSSRC